jgi:hypothetical protein
MSPPSRLHRRLDEMDLSRISRPRLLQRNVVKAGDVLDHFVKVRCFLPGVLSFDACRVNFFWMFCGVAVPEFVEEFERHSGEASGSADDQALEVFSWGFGCR